MFRRVFGTDRKITREIIQFLDRPTKIAITAIITPSRNAPPTAIPTITPTVDKNSVHELAKSVPVLRFFLLPHLALSVFTNMARVVSVWMGVLVKFLHDEEDTRMDVKFPYFEDR